MRTLANPQLYADDEGRPVLLASKCQRCDRVAFPALRIGCDSCGAAEDQLQSVRLAATGIAHSSVVVPGTAGKSQPFAVAELRLDAGPLIRVMVSSGEPVRIGDRLDGGWASSRSDDDGNELFEPIFGRATPNSEAGK